MNVASNPIGAAAAFISHFVWDYVGEKSIGSTKQSATIEGALLLVFLVGALLAGNFWLSLLGWVLGNLPDLIDKPLDWWYDKKQWFSCHNGEGLFKIRVKGNTYKLGYPVKIALTKVQTLWFNIGSTIVWLLFCIAVK